MLFVLSATTNLYLLFFIKDDGILLITYDMYFQNHRLLMRSSLKKWDNVILDESLKIKKILIQDHSVNEYNPELQKNRDMWNSITKRSHRTTLPHPSRIRDLLLLGSPILSMATFYSFLSMSHFSLFLSMVGYLFSDELHIS